jgi:hypothetical protein
VTSIGWDFETDPENPQPVVYPVCSDCGEPYSYARHLSLATGTYVWAWAKPPKQPRQCRHKGPPEINDTRSPLVSSKETS